MDYEKKVEELLKQLTLDEKIGMIHGAGLFQTKGVERLGIKPLKMADGPRGVREEFENDKWIPLNQADDYVTYLPSGSAIASTWNNHLAYQYGQVLGSEARGRGKDVILAPSINIIRSPLGGRNFEYLSEDPYLTSQMAVQMVKGIQEADVVSCAKHFAVNNQETNRLGVDVIIKKKTLYEIYFKAFKDIITKANAYGIMSAYNKINGVFCSQNQWLLNKVLREEWNYQGLVISDWGAVNDTLGAASAGLDIEMSVTSNFDDYFLANPLKKKLKSGEVEVGAIDEKVRNILRTMYKIKKLGATDDRKAGAFNTKAHQKLAYDLALESIVLLKNEDNILPLKNNIKDLLVIGDNAIRLHAHKGGSAEIKALYEISPLMGLKMRFGGKVEIKYTEGYYIPDKINKNDKHWQELSLEKQLEEKTISQAVKAKEKEYLQTAVKLASEYENVLIFAGLNHDYDLEGQDRKDMNLPYRQDELISEVLKVNPRAIIHLLSGSALDISKWQQKAKTLLWSSYLGMETGKALASIIFGDVSPSGKLTQTFAYKLEDYSSHQIGEFPGKAKVHYYEEEDVGYRHFLRKNIKPLFPFGHGLSYSQFSYDGFSYYRTGNSFIFKIKIKNSGNCDAAETLQIYLKKTQEPLVLKAYEKVFLKEGEEKTLSLSLDEEAFSYYQEELAGFVLEKGRYQVMLGSSLVKIIKQIEIEV
ncbi:MAG: glycoside hydrolase family 3 C-terminal domain-containing protein [Bacilli bacterium]|nr:glycoside hydrolase family 3 C-terminal domain-containing protein [Bacilli bacterium]